MGVYPRDTSSNPVEGNGYFFPSHRQLYLSSFSDTPRPTQRRSLQMLGVVAPFSKGQDGFCDYLYKVSTKQTPRQSSHSTAPIEGKDNTELDR